MKELVNRKKWFGGCLIFFIITLAAMAAVNVYARKKAVPTEELTFNPYVEGNEKEKYDKSHQCYYIIKTDENGEKYALITQCYSEKKEVALPAELDHCPVRELAMQSCTLDNAKRIIIPDTVQKIGMQAFSGSWELEELVIPSSVRELEVNEYNGKKYPIVDIGEQEIRDGTESIKYTVKEVTFYTEAGSAAAKHAEEFGIKWKDISELK